MPRMLMQDSVAKFIDERSRQLAKAILADSLNNIANAIEQTLREELKFGDKRLARFTEKMNEKLPEHNQFIFKKAVEINGKEERTSAKTSANR